MTELPIQKAVSSGLHDYQVGEIAVDYCQGRVVLTLMDSRGKLCRLCIKGIRNFQLTRTEPWGPGIYVSVSDLIKKEDGLCQLQFQLNSGDEIIVDMAEEPVL